MLSCHPHKGNNGNGDDHYLLCFTHTPSAPIIRHTICNDKALYNRVENMIRLLRLFPCRFYTSLLTSIVLWSIFFACVHANSPGQPTFDKYVNRGLTIAATKTQMTRKPILSVRMASYNTYFSCQLCHTATCDRGGASNVLALVYEQQQSFAQAEILLFRQPYFVSVPFWFAAHSQWIFTKDRTFTIRHKHTVHAVDYARIQFSVLQYVHRTCIVNWKEYWVGLLDIRALRD